MYTMDNWERDKVFNAQVNEPVSIEVFYEMRDCVPPAYYGKGFMQVGEPYTHDRTTGAELYDTFEKVDEQWIFRGYLPLMND